MSYRVLGDEYTDRHDAAIAALHKRAVLEVLEGDVVAATWFYGDNGWRQVCFHEVTRLRVHWCLVSPGHRVYRYRGHPATALQLARHLDFLDLREPGDHADRPRRPGVVLRLRWVYGELYPAQIT